MAPTYRYVYFPVHQISQFAAEVNANLKDGFYPSHVPIVTGGPGQAVQWLYLGMIGDPDRPSFKCSTERPAKRTAKKPKLDF